MAPVMSPKALLPRMEDARRQTQRQLDLIDRKFTRRMTSSIISRDSPASMQVSRSSRG